MKGRHSRAAAHIAVVIAAFGLASAMGVLQTLSIAEIEFPQRHASLYYLSATDL